MRLIQIQRQLGRFALQHLEPARHRLPQMRHHLRAQFLIAFGLRRLPLQRIHLPADFFQNVEHARKILPRALQLRLRQALLGLVFSDPRGFLDDGAPVRRLVRKNLPDASLLDDRVALRAQARAAEQILNVAQPRGVAVDQIFALARPVQAPRDGDLFGSVIVLPLAWPFAWPLPLPLPLPFSVAPWTHVA